MLHQRRRPPEHARLCEPASCPHVFTHSHDPSGPLSTLSHPPAQRLIGLGALTSASDWTTHRGSAKARSGGKTGENQCGQQLVALVAADRRKQQPSGLAGGSLCVAVVMWATLALRNRRKCLFMTPVTFLSPQRDLGNSAISSADAGSQNVLSGLASI